MSGHAWRVGPWSHAARRSWCRDCGAIRVERAQKWDPLEASGREGVEVPIGATSVIASVWTGGYEASDVPCTRPKGD